MRIHHTASLLGPAARGAVRLVMQIALATPRRVFIRAGVAAVVAGIGANALLLHIGRHPSSLLAPATHDTEHPAAVAGTVERVALNESPTPISKHSTASAVAPPAAGGSLAPQASAPDITSSIERASQDKRHQSLAPESEQGSAGPDRISALLRDKPIDGGSHLVRAAQIALAKLGYGVKPDGAEDGATRRALRHFERAHGLAPTTKISPELVEQLIAAAGG